MSLHSAHRKAKTGPRKTSATSTDGKAHGMGGLRRTVLAFLLASLASACSGIAPSTPVSTSAPICAGGAELGRTSVQLHTEWRTDQKDPAGRRALAMQAMARAMASVPCIRSLTHGAPSSATETQVKITLREFGPELILSVPVIWTSRTHVDASIRVTDLRNGRVLFTASDDRREGGAFAIRPLGAVGDTFEAMIADWFIGANPGPPDA